MGRTPVNLLVLGFIWHGLAVPLFWQAFPHDGNSNTAVHLGEGGPKAERIALLERLMALLEVHFPHLPVAGPLDDREFVGSRWFTYLRARRLPRCIRIRANTRLGSRKARDWSRSLRVEEARALRGKRRVLGEALRVVGVHLGREAWLIVATDLDPREALEVYGLRWGIEGLLGTLKGRGFDLEGTRVADPRRLSLFLILSLAFSGPSGWGCGCTA